MRHVAARQVLERVILSAQQPLGRSHGDVGAHEVAVGCGVARPRDTVLREEVRHHALALG
jgi:hypothetical protein